MNITTTYSEPLVELVSLVIEVDHGDSHKLFVTIVVAPVDSARRDDDDIAAADPVDLLVEVSALTPAPPSLLLPSLPASRRYVTHGSLGLVGLSAAREGDSENATALLDEDKAGAVGVLGEEEGVGAEDVPDGSDAGTLELVLFLIPDLGGASLRLNAVGGLEGPDSVKAALLGRGEAGGGVALAEGYVEKLQEGEDEG